MQNETSPPVDTIELLLREIQAQLRRLARRPPVRGAVIALLAAVALIGCGHEPMPDGSPPNIATAHEITGDVAASQAFCTGDADCAGDRPLCDRAVGQCVGCDGAFGSRSSHPCGSATPVCDPFGTCTIECADSSACADRQLACEAAHCRSCTTDEQCSSGRCHDDGRCAAMSAVAYIDHDHPCRNEPHYSTPDDPYCEIAPALSDSGDAIVHLGASAVAYAAFVLDGTTSRDVTILGPGSGLAVVAPADGPAVTLSARQGKNVRLAISDLAISGGLLGAGVDCNAKSDHGELVLRSVSLRGGAEQGLVSVGCHVRLERSLVRDNAGGGVVLTMSSYELDHDLIFDNAGVGIDLVASTGTLSHLTLTGNRGAHAAGLRCDTAAQISDSIVVGNVSAQSSGTDAELDPACVVVNSVLGDGATRGIACTPSFVASDDPHLDVSNPAAQAANQACVLGRSAAGGLDVDGQSSLGALGADEP
jgi:hypothetical protein